MPKSNGPQDLLDKLEEQPNGCWIFTGSCHPKGYGSIRYQGKNWKAHKLAYHFFKGPIPEGLWILHTCDNPPCCNPEHLYAGTAQDNADDRHNRNRTAISVTEEQILQITDLLGKYSQSQIARMCGTSQSTVNRIALHSETRRYQCLPQLA